MSRCGIQSQLPSREQLTTNVAMGTSAMERKHAKPECACQEFLLSVTTKIYEQVTPAIPCSDVCISKFRAAVQVEVAGVEAGAAEIDGVRSV